MKETTVIKAKNEFSLDLKEIFKYRELFLILAIRDIKVRYKQTFFGALWAIAQPLSSMIIFSFFFGNLAKISSDGIPYPVFSYTGLLLWTFFSNSVNVASSSLLNDARLISKVYFPRLIIPISTTFVSIIDYFVAELFLIILLIFYGINIHLSMLFSFVILIFTWILSLGLGMFFAALNVKYRDVKYVVPFFFQLLIFATPVIYPVSVSGRFKWLLFLNPMSGYIEAHRQFLIGNYSIDWVMLSVSIISTILIFIFGLIYFKKVEKYFADII